MVRGQLNLIVLVAIVIGLIAHHIIGGLIFDSDWLTGYATYTVNVLSLYILLLMFTPKTIDKQLKITVRPKELDPNKAYMFQSNQQLTLEEFKGFVKEINNRYQNKGNIIANSDILEVSERYAK
jgi:hypothetical protein